MAKRTRNPVWNQGFSFTDVAGTDELWADVFDLEDPRFDAMHLGKAH